MFLAVCVLATLASVFALWWARGFLVPVCFAILLSCALRPIVTRLQGIGVPSSLGALLVTLVVIALSILAVLTLQDGAGALAEAIPRALRRTLNLAGFRYSEFVANVPFKPMLWAGAIGGVAVLLGVLGVLLLTYFLLAAGDQLPHRIAAIAGGERRTRAAALALLRELEHTVHRYLVVVIVTNALLGLATWGAFRLFGVKDAAVWGALAALAHFVPYVGPAVIAAGSTMIATLQFSSLAQGLWVGGATLLLSTVIGVLLTTWWSGRTARMNVIAVFLTLLFWGWIWGIPGLFLGTPIMMGLKVIAAHRPALRWLDAALGDELRFHHREVTRMFRPGLTRGRGAALACLIAIFCIAGMRPAVAQEAGTPGSAGPEYFGLLRARDLTFFSLLRLDMRPAHAVTAEPGAWAVETTLGYQNTWSLSRNVETYLKSLPGRRELGPAEVAAIQSLPGDNYLIDAELGVVDVAFDYQVSRRVSVYAIASGVRYDGGFADGLIERFHQGFGFGTFRRTALARNRVNVVFDLKDANQVFLGAPTGGGLLDPTFGVRYSGVELPRHWNLVIEAAAKVPLSGRREWLSTGRTDYGAQATLQHFWSRNALYVSVAAVRFAGDPTLPLSVALTVPTAVVGLEHKFSQDTHMILQAYASRSTTPSDQTDNTDLTKNKYQLSLGIYHRVSGATLSFAITENLQNVNNTPDIGLQMGFVVSPTLRR
jgi:predicted PurR-regulated permease PerM